MFNIYILYSPEYKRFYIGCTSSLEKRLLRHNAGYVQSTKAYRPWEIVVSEIQPTRIDARRREAYLKSLKNSAKAVKLLRREGPVA